MAGTDGVAPSIGGALAAAAMANSPKGQT